MKRAVMLLAVGALILGSTLSAMAQPPTVSFGGQMRVYGFVSDNVTDFKDSDKGASRDSNSFFFQRFRLFTTIESADKKARAFWALEIGDITWGTGGGASGAEWGCNGQTAPGVVNIPTVDATTGTPGTLAVPVSATGAGNRVGNGSGGCLGNDGINVETKNLYIWLNTSDWVPNSSVLLGIHNTVFLNTAVGAFFDDDAAGIQLNFKFDPVDLQVWSAKFAERSIANADDVDAYAARLGVNVTKDVRLTLEGLVVDQRDLAGQSFGDSFWIGVTGSAKLGTVSLGGAFVYGQRALAAAAGASCGSATSPCEEKGYGLLVTAQMPVGPANLWVVGMYTSGDDTRAPGSGSAGTLTKDSDRLPLPEAGASWINSGAPFIGEGLFGLQTIGGPAPGGNTAIQYADPAGLYVIGASATFALAPTVTVGGGVAYIGATDAPSTRFGDNVVDINFGVIHRFNPNLTITGIASYMLPDTGDNAWLLGFRTQFAF